MKHKYWKDKTYTVCIEVNHFNFQHSCYVLSCILKVYVLLSWASSFQMMEKWVKVTNTITRLDWYLILINMWPHPRPLENSNIHSSIKQKGLTFHREKRKFFTYWLLKYVERFSMLQNYATVAEILSAHLCIRFTSTIDIVWDKRVTERCFKGVSNIESVSYDWYYCTMYQPTDISIKIGQSDTVIWNVTSLISAN